MTGYLRRRLLQLLPVLFGITFLSFALMHLAAGDTVQMMQENTGMAVSQQILDERRARLGLDQPFLVQYLNWLKGVLTGDMGVSYVSGRPVSVMLREKIPGTLRLTAVSILLTMLISIPLGILSAVKENRVSDYLVRLFSFIGNSMPDFFVSLILILLFSVKFTLFPVIGNGKDVTSMILPVITLTIAMSAKYTRQIRAAVLEELHQDYVIGARARGVSEGRIIISSVLRSSLLTIVTLLALSIGSLLGGTAIVETIFMWDGVGKMAVDAVTMRDYPVIQAYVVWMAVIYVMINLLADLLYHYLDPRISRDEEVRS